MDTQLVKDTLYFRKAFSGLETFKQMADDSAAKGLNFYETPFTKRLQEYLRAINDRVLIPYMSDITDGKDLHLSITHLKAQLDNIQELRSFINMKVHELIERLMTAEFEKNEDSERSEVQGKKEYLTSRIDPWLSHCSYVMRSLLDALVFSSTEQSDAKSIIKESGDSPRTVGIKLLFDDDKEQYQRKIKNFSSVLHEMKLFDNSVEDIIKLFEGSYIDKKLNWIGQGYELAYFIRRLVQGHVIVRASDRSKIWVRCKECFLINGNEINPRSLSQSRQVASKAFQDAVKRMFELL